MGRINKNLSRSYAGAFNHCAHLIRYVDKLYLGSTFYANYFFVYLHTFSKKLFNFMLRAGHMDRLFFPENFCHRLCHPRIKRPWYYHINSWLFYQISDSLSRC